MVKKHFYVAGLLLFQLTETQVQPFLSPSPHQIALHVESKINPSFMNDTHRRYNHKFWKPLDCVVVNDLNYFHLSSTLLSINLENNSAVVKTMLERDQLLLPLSSLERVY